MAPKHLSVVQGDGDGTEVETSTNTDLHAHGRETDSVAERVKRLQEEARLLAREEIQTLESQLIATAEMALAIAHGGDAYPVGVRGMAEQLAHELPQRVQSLKAIMERVNRG